MAESNSPKIIYQKLLAIMYVNIATAINEFPNIKLTRFPREFIKTVAGTKNIILNIGYVDSASKTSAALIPLVSVKNRNIIA